MLKDKVGIIRGHDKDLTQLLSDAMDEVSKIELSPSGYVISVSTEFGSYADQTWTLTIYYGF